VEGGAGGDAFGGITGEKWRAKKGPSRSALKGSKSGQRLKNLRTPEGEGERAEGRGEKTGAGPSEPGKFRVKSGKGRLREV